MDPSHFAEESLAWVLLDAYGICFFFKKDYLMAFFGDFLGFLAELVVLNLKFWTIFRFVALVDLFSLIAQYSLLDL